MSFFAADKNPIPTVFSNRFQLTAMFTALLSHIIDTALQVVSAGQQCNPSEQQTAWQHRKWQLPVSVLHCHMNYWCYISLY